LCFDRRRGVRIVRSGPYLNEVDVSRIAEFVSAAASACPKKYQGLDRLETVAGQLSLREGERLDGHDFVEQALEKGGSAACGRSVGRYPGEIDYWRSKHAGRASDLATRCGIVGQAVVAVTGRREDDHEGSDRACLAAVSGAEVGRDFNNQFGFRDAVEAEARRSRIEMGMSHAGKFGAGEIAQPEVWRGYKCGGGASGIFDHWRDARRNMSVDRCIEWNGVLNAATNMSPVWEGLQR